MAAYKDLVGQKITKVTSNPGEPKTGQMWYNSTAGKLRGLGVVEAWASQGPLLEARSSGAGFGVSTAAVYAGGQTSPGASSANTFEYNGSGWSTGGALNTARMELGGTTAGIETAGLCFGGNTAPGWNGTAATEEYNGTAWTSVNNMATTVSSMGGSGIQTAAFSAGGRTPSNTNNSQEYDGTDWSNGNNINTTRQFLAGMGTQTAGIIAGGEAPGGGSNSAETYDGTNFTAAPNMGTARYRLSGSGSDSTACLVFGGRFNPPAADKAQTESFDGTSWTEKADLATARQQLSGNRGTSSSAIAAGGLPPPASQTTDTEEFTRSINTITAATWSSGGAAPVGNSNMNMAGYKDDAMMWGGDTGGPPGAWPTASHSYNGTSWSSEGSIPSVRVVGKQFGAGHTDATGMGGYPGINAATIQYNGSAWTAGGSANHGNEYGYNTGAGPQTAGAILGGGGSSAKHENYNGTSWTEKTDFPSGANFVGTIGTQTALLGVSGANGTTATWNGSAWTAVPSTLNTPRQYGAAGGANSSEAYMFGGGPPSVRTQTELYNGTSWASQPNMANGRNSAGGSGISNSGLIAGAFYPGNTAVEEFTAETTAINIADFTTS